MRFAVRSLCVVTLSLGASAANAAVIVTGNTGWSVSTPTVGWPASPAIATSPAPNSFGTARDLTGGSPAFNVRHIFQTFQVGTTFQLDKVYVPYQKANPGDSFTLRIFTVNDVNAAPATYTPDGSGYDGDGASSLLLSVAVTLPGLASDFVAGTSTKGVMEFDLTGLDEITLNNTSGTAGYALQFYADQGTVSAFSPQLTSGSGAGQGDAYTPGRVYEWNGSAWADFSGRDIAFAMTSVVPEPSSCLLICVGCMGLFGLRSRRRK